MRLTSSSLIPALDALLEEVDRLEISTPACAMRSCSSADLIRRSSPTSSLASAGLGPEVPTQVREELERQLVVDDGPGRAGSGPRRANASSTAGAGPTRSAHGTTASKCVASMNSGDSKSGITMTAESRETISAVRRSVGSARKPSA